MRFADPSVGAVFKVYPPALRSRLMMLRQLIFETARTTEGVGELHEALKWGQPSYLAPASKSGSTIRIDRTKSRDDQYAIYFHCQTDLVTTFRELYPKQLTFAGNRSIVLNVADELRHCVGLTLTYHLRKAQLRQS